MNEYIVWVGIAFCLSQSAIFSGLNLAFFSLTRLRLEIEAESSASKGAKKVLAMRKDSNFLLTTILWGNVSINVLLTLLSGSIMAGVASFLFSSVFITFFGEIIPQAYFSRHALKMASLLAPVIRIYQVVLYPVAKPCALLLDKWLGKESVQYFAEKNIKLFIKKHMEDYNSEIDHVEGTGAINFFTLDDIKIVQEGEEINPESIISIDTLGDELIFPKYKSSVDDEFIRRLNKSGEKWIIFTNFKNEPLLTLEADEFFRSEIINDSRKGIIHYCHKPIVVKHSDTNLGMAIKRLKTKIHISSDSPIKNDVVLFWQKKNKRILTGADILGRLLKGI